MWACSQTANGRNFGIASQLFIFNNDADQVHEQKVRLPGVTVNTDSVVRNTCRAEPRRHVRIVQYYDIYTWIASLSRVGGLRVFQSTSTFTFQH